MALCYQPVARRRPLYVLTFTGQAAKRAEAWDVRRDPFEGIGKPERLRHALAGA